MFEIERVQDRERKIGYSLHKGTETLVRNRERFEIESVRDRESQLYTLIFKKKVMDKFSVILVKCNYGPMHDILPLPMGTKRVFLVL